MSDIETKEVEIRFKIDLHKELKKCNDEIEKNKGEIQKLVHRNIYVQSRHDILTDFCVSAVSRDVVEDVAKGVMDELSLQTSKDEPFAKSHFNATNKKIISFLNAQSDCAATLKEITMCIFNNECSFRLAKDVEEYLNLQIKQGVGFNKFLSDGGCYLWQYVSQIDTNKCETFDETIKSKSKSTKKQLSKKDQIVTFIGHNNGEYVNTITTQIYGHEYTDKNKSTIKGILQRCPEFDSFDPHLWELTKTGEYRLEKLNGN